MRVLILVLEDFPGGDTRVRRQVSALDAAGHEVRVLCASAYSKDSQYLGARVQRTWTRRVKAGTMRRRLFEYAFFSAEAFWRVVWLSLSYRPQVVQIANMPDFLVAAALPARWLCGAGLLLDMHDLMPELLASKAKSGGVIGRFIRWQEHLGIRLADKVMTVNGICAARLQSRHPARQVAVIPNAPDARTFPRLDPRQRDGGAIRIGYHGTVAKRFGVSTLVAAVAELHRGGLPLALEIWGGGDDLDEVRSLASQLGIGAVTTLHGQVRVDVLVEGLKGIDLSVVPYEADAYMAIAYSTKAFELAQMGIPMVVSDLPGIREQFSADAALFVPAGDPGSLAVAMRQLATDPGKAIQQARQAQLEVKRFDWDLLSAQYVSELAQIAQGVGGARP
jgi:glycosyltransferase involved in cell wall biosynthesis